MIRTRIFLVVGLIASLVAATNSGVYADNGVDIVQPPSDSLARRHPREFPTRDLDGQDRTNAGRMRSGLPLLAPRFKWSKTSPALQPRTSPVVCPLIQGGQGVIEVHRLSDGVLLGVVQNTYDAQQTYTYSSSGPTALTVQLPATVASGVAMELIAVNGPDTAHPYFGAVGGSGGYHFETGQVGYAYLSGTGHTPANSPPSFTAGNSIQALGYNGPSESTIWLIDCTTLKLTPQWTNSDDTQNPTTIFYDATGNYLSITGDLNAFNSAFGEDTSPVTFTYHPSV